MAFFKPFLISTVLGIVAGGANAMWTSTPQYRADGEHESGSRSTCPMSSYIGDTERDHLKTLLTIDSLRKEHRVRKIAHILGSLEVHLVRAHMLGEKIGRGEHPRLRKMEKVNALTNTKRLVNDSKLAILDQCRHTRLFNPTTETFCLHEHDFALRSILSRIEEISNDCTDLIERM